MKFISILFFLTTTFSEALWMKLMKALTIPLPPHLVVYA